MNRQQLYYGEVPVPYSVLWTGEKGHMAVGRCAHTGAMACTDIERRGEGKPIFGDPHMNRQREVITKDLCDLCAKPMRLKTKVSLSHARVVASGGDGPAVMQVEPLLHKECALRCVDYCPSLKRDIKQGTLHVRQVSAYRKQLSMLTSDAVEEFCGVRMNAVGHAKIELIRWIDRDLDWLKGR